ncbi:hypothetical protein [Bradyrhizobium lablabi]|nr:hypothetical protein [Bradyrhizobium lablabi]
MTDSPYPRTSTNRLNEISFNSSPAKELGMMRSTADLEILFEEF